MTLGQGHANATGEGGVGAAAMWLATSRVVSALAGVEVGAEPRGFGIRCTPRLVERGGEGPA